MLDRSNCHRWSLAWLVAFRRDWRVSNKLWSALRNRTSAITESFRRIAGPPIGIFFQRHCQGKAYMRRGGFLATRRTTFDAAFFWHLTA